MILAECGDLSLCLPSHCKTKGSSCECATATLLLCFWFALRAARCEKNELGCTMDVFSPHRNPHVAGLSFTFYGQFTIRTGL